LGQDEAVLGLGRPLFLALGGGQRLAVINAQTEETPPPHHRMFRDLLAIARPIIEVERLVQRHDGYRREPSPRRVRVYPGMTHLVTTCIVQFLYDGHEYSFRAYPSYRWLDIDSVVTGFNAFMAQIGRNDRCYQFPSIDDVRFFAVAPEAKFGPLVERLRIPLDPPPREPPRGIDFGRQAASSSQT
jgi:hypothetical protein